MNTMSRILHGVWRPLFVQEQTNHRRLPSADRLRKLEEQRAPINAEIQRGRRRESQEERRRDTRHEILMGPMMLERVEDRKTSEKWVKAEMDRFLKREQDRALFGLSLKALDSSQLRGT